ncbi:hypothetical protein ACE7GA_23920 [Roseomonas sp. CCTCC AB2023176]|uniref:hypothetical protein n=1 Tax=Roseomonas sp. CCTCC AB2023176 TaxID=3342640 RepID=UPI0035D5F9AC
MRLVHAADVPPVPFSTHRSGRIENVRLLGGQEGTPDNYELSLVLIEGEYSTPRHRHNFDQVRVMLEGRFGFGRDRVQEEGSVGYFCEGVYYEQGALGPSLTLLYQGAGASGSGFMSYRQTDSGKTALERRGRFEKGVFTVTRPEGGRINQDAYEAIWEEVNARPIAYPTPRYDMPVIMNPAAFEWVQEADGLRRKRLGGFGERGMAVSTLRLDPGATYRAGPGRLIFVITGTGAVAGERYGTCSAIATDSDAETVLRAEAPSEFFEMVLPRFDGAAVAARAA